MMYELNSQPSVQSKALELATKISTEMKGVCPKVSTVRQQMCTVGNAALIFGTRKGKLSFSGYGWMGTLICPHTKLTWLKMREIILKGCETQSNIMKDCPKLLTQNSCVLW